MNRSDLPGLALPILFLLSVVFHGCQPRPAEEPRSESADRPPRPTAEFLAATHGHGHELDPTDHNYGPETVRSDVRSAAVAQMLHRLQNGVFASSLEELDFTPSDMIELHLVAQDSSGFTIVGEFQGSPSHECAIRHGMMPVPRPYVHEADVIFCG